MGTILDSANNVAVHTITVIARVCGGDKIAVVVRLTVECAAKLRSARNGCRVAGGRSDVVGVTVVTNRAADAFL